MVRKVQLCWWSAQTLLELAPYFSLDEVLDQKVVLVLTVLNTHSVPWLVQFP